MDTWESGGSIRMSPESSRFLDLMFRGLKFSRLFWGHPYDLGRDCEEVDLRVAPVRL